MCSVFLSALGAPLVPVMCIRDDKLISLISIAPMTSGIRQIRTAHIKSKYQMFFLLYESVQQWLFGANILFSFDDLLTVCCAWVITKLEPVVESDSSDGLSHRIRNPKGRRQKQTSKEEKQWQTRQRLGKKHRTKPRQKDRGIEPSKAKQVEDEAG